MRWFKKSVINDMEHSILVRGDDYIAADTSTTPSNLILHNRNFVYACVQKIAQYLSSVPIHMYYETKSNTKLFTPHKSVSKLVSKAHKSNTRIILKAESEIVEITEHPVLDLMQHPAKGMSWSDWVSLCSSYLKITGNFLCEIVMDGENITALEPLKWEHVELIYDRTTGAIKQYRYYPPNQAGRYLDPEQVIHIMDKQPGSLITGMGALESCMSSAALYNAYDAYQIALAKNYGVPGAHIQVNTSTKNKSKEELGAIANDFVRKFGGRNQGKPIVTIGDEVKINPIATSPRDMEYKQGREWSKKVICATMGVPEDLVDVTDSNRASSVTAIKSFIQLTIYPLLNKILEAINETLVRKYFDTDAYIWYDQNEILDKDPVEQAQLLKTYIDAGIMTVDEARDVLGMAPMAPKEVSVTPIEQVAPIGE